MVVRVRSATVTAAMGRLIEGGGERHRGAKHSTIHKTNVRRAVTRRAYRVLGQDRATIGGQICLRNPAVGFHNIDHLIHQDRLLVATAAVAMESPVGTACTD